MMEDDVSIDNRLELPRFGCSRDFPNMDRLLSRPSKTIIANIDPTRFQRIEDMSGSAKSDMSDVEE